MSDAGKVRLVSATAILAWLWAAGRFDFTGTSSLVAIGLIVAIGELLARMVAPTNPSKALLWAFGLLLATGVAIMNIPTVAERAGNCLQEYAVRAPSPIGSRLAASYCEILTKAGSSSQERTHAECIVKGASIAQNDIAARLVPASCKQLEPPPAAAPATQQPQQPVTAQSPPSNADAQANDPRDALLQHYLGSLTDAQWQAAFARWIELHPEAASPESQVVIYELVKDVAQQYPAIAVGPALDMALQRGLRNAREAEIAQREQQGQ